MFIHINSRKWPRPLMDEKWEWPLTLSFLPSQSPPVEPPPSPPLPVCLFSHFLLSVTLPPLSSFDQIVEVVVLSHYHYKYINIILLNIFGVRDQYTIPEYISHIFFTYPLGWCVQEADFTKAMSSFAVIIHNHIFAS